jgi:gas vesicle protein
MSSEKVILGLLAGATLGVLAGILLAPAKGSDTRERILKNSEGFVDELKDKFTGLIDEVTKNIDKVNGEKI